MNNESDDDTKKERQERRRRLEWIAFTKQCRIEDRITVVVPSKHFQPGVSACNQIDLTLDIEKYLAVGSPAPEEIVANAIARSKAFDESGQHPHQEKPSDSGEAKQP